MRIDGQKHKVRASHIAVGVAAIRVGGLMYVWFQVNITKMNYAIAREIQMQERLVEEGRLLRMEIEVLKSPGRLEKIARETLKMKYPESGQVVRLNE